MVGRGETTGIMIKKFSGKAGNPRCLANMVSET